MPDSMKVAVYGVSWVLISIKPIMFRVVYRIWPLGPQVFGHSGIIGFSHY